MPATDILGEIKHPYFEEYLEFIKDAHCQPYFKAANSIQTAL